MQYWLMKTEPDVFSIDDLKNAPGQRAGWDGVRNYQARNFMRDGMRMGDQIFFYHSSCDPPGIAGIAEVCKECYPDPTQFDRKSEYYDPKASSAKPIWYMVEVKFIEKFPRLVTLDELKNLQAKLGDFPLLKRGNRLSVMPVSPAHWKQLLKFCK